MSTLTNCFRRAICDRRLKAAGVGCNFAARYCHGCYDSTILWIVWLTNGRLRALSSALENRGHLFSLGVHHAVPVRLYLPLGSSFSLAPARFKQFYQTNMEQTGETPERSYSRLVAQRNRCHQPQHTHRAVFRSKRRRRTDQADLRPRLPILINDKGGRGRQLGNIISAHVPHVRTTATCSVQRASSQKSGCCSRWS